MSLDIERVASQIEDMGVRLRAEAQEHERRLDFALATLHSQATAFHFLQNKVQASRTTWLVAGLKDELDSSYGVPACPGNFSVLATDGSHIDVDRHRPARCYLINIGSTYLRYGEAPDAILTSSPVLYSQEEELAITAPPPNSDEAPITGVLLGMKRSVEECRGLARMAAALEDTSPALALLDGSLILWGLAGEAYPHFVTETILENGLLKCLDEMRVAAEHKRLALASYISFPRSTEVVNVLRVALCPYQPADCDRHCAGRHASGERECDAVAGLRDGELFSRLLAPGERSAVFISRSSVVKNFYGLHWVHFFYLKLDDEIARVEFPSWVAEDKSLLNLVHALVWDQCCRGQGYPTALSEAHEKAVLTSGDREQFWHLVEQALVAEGLPVTASAKSKSKLRRWV